MYINITVDLANYNQDALDLRISNRQPVKQLIRTVWTIAGIHEAPREGYWVRVVNKGMMIRGFDVLHEMKITDGDKLLVL
ncbi:EsaB/YukD family protein [Sporolactobacillus terrae]|uniref:ESX secretion system protein YukD n=1 Tax=Sporolactobacillus terrae TaxID=269673 RepID=A0A5K7X0V5_9BACL|nr:EsaB/YukD family protein [Sporolactobacillus terrae]BBO00163.1 ESX secretion system protein YukD [Sporolactobacillus terrae]